MANTGKCLSLICIVNDQGMFEGFRESLLTQTYQDYELIPVMNKNGEYSSARRAFNEASVRANGRYLLFIHPDIRFEDPDALKDIIGYITEERVPADFGVCGAAGAVREGNGREIISTIFHGDSHQRVGTSISAPQEVETLDECFFIISADYLKDHPFSDTEGWHLYACEYCLEAISDSRKNYVLPSRIWHLSDGKSLNKDYILQLEDLIRKERDSFDMICTTVKAWKTKGMIAFLYRKYYYVKQCVKSRLLK